MALLPLESPDFGLATIGGISLHTPAWQCTNTYLLTDPAPRRRNNRKRPGVAGTYGGPGFKDEWSVELEIAINGWWNADGSPNANPAAGAESHFLYLTENILDEPGDLQGRLTCTVTSAISGGLYSGYVQIDHLRREPQRNAACVYMDVTLPSGGLVFSGP